MSIRQVVDCDRCGKEGGAPVYLQTGWESCPVGGAGHHIRDRFDLCANCALECLQEFITDFFEEYEDAKRWIDKNKKLKYPKHPS